MCLWLCVCLQDSLTVIKVSVVVGIASTFDIGAFPACRAELRNALGHMWRSWEMNFREWGTFAKFSCLISLLGKWGCNCIAFVTLLDKSHLAKNRVHGFHFPLRYDWRLQKNDSVMLVNLTSEAIVLIWCNNPWLWGRTQNQKTRKFKIYKPDAEPGLWKSHEAD